MKQILLLIVVGLLLSPLPSETLGVAIPLRDAAATSPDWNSTIQINQAGERGDWIFFYHVLPQPLPQFIFMRFNGTFSVQPPSDGNSQVVYSVPDFVVTQAACCNVPRTIRQAVHADNTWAIQGVLSGLRIINLAGGNQTFPVEENLGGGAEAPVHAISFVIGADVPWRLNLTVQMVSGQVLPGDPSATVGSEVQPTFLFHGHALSIHKFSETPGPNLPNGYTSGSISENLELVDPGWTHIQYDWYNAHDDWRAPKQPFPSPQGTRVGLHHYATAFPNGFTEVGPVSVELNEPGAYFPIPLRAWGTMADTPGKLHLQILRADDSVNVSATVLHLPMNPGTLPSEIQVWSYACQYADIQWQLQGSTESACGESYTNTIDVDGGIVN